MVTHKNIITIILLTPTLISAQYIKYYCPSTDDFKIVKGNKNIQVAHTDYKGVTHTWYAKDPNPSEFPESPQMFKGANLTNCKDQICEIECIYYSNIENNVIIATATSQPSFKIPEQPNNYLKDNQCQFTEHVDCPFVIEV